MSKFMLTEGVSSTLIFNRRDAEFITRTIQFGTYTADQFLRATEPIKAWRDIYINGTEKHNRVASTRNIRSRATRLCKTEPPLLTRARLYNGLLGYQPTEYARDLLALSETHTEALRATNQSAVLYTVDIVQQCEALAPVTHLLRDGCTIRNANDQNELVIRVDRGLDGGAVVNKINALSSRYWADRIWVVTRSRDIAKTIDCYEFNVPVIALKGEVSELDYYYVRALDPEKPSSAISAAWFGEGR